MTRKNSRSGRFPDTQWSLIGRAAASDELGRQRALAEVLGAYAPALRAFLIASRRMPVDLADDLVQDFVADKILARGLLKRVDRRKGKFRNYLMKSLGNFANTRLRQSHTVQERQVALDTTEALDVTSTQAADAFDQQWVQQVVRNAVESMRVECAAESRSDLWEVFRLRVVDPVLNGTEPTDYADIVCALDIETPRKAINLLVTAKRRFMRHLHGVIAKYTDGEAELEVELLELRRIVGR